jgi:pyridoxal phosphate enzyme (YggS family)
VDAIRLRAELEKRIDAVEERIQAACERAGRERAAVTLVAVTKNVPDEVVGVYLEFCRVHLDLGENRPQQLWRRAALLPSFVHWHLIGHLQRNKIARTLPLVRLIHSADRRSLLEALEEQAAPLSRPVDVLLEINTSREPSKQGFAPEEVLDLAPWLNNGLKNVRIRGLMTMAAFEEDPERCRPCFVLLRQLRDRLGAQLHGEHKLEHLSMGMSNDFEVAIEEGATLVRIGTALFEGLLPESPSEVAREKG